MEINKTALMGSFIVKMFYEYLHFFNIICTFIGATDFD